MTSPTCPRCSTPVYFAEKVSSLGENWHRFCLKCERCNKTLSAGSHAEHDRKPYCHKPCYAALFGPKGVNIGGVGSYIYDTPPLTPKSLSPLSPASSSLLVSRSEDPFEKQAPKSALKETFKLSVLPLMKSEYAKRVGPSNDELN